MTLDLSELVFFKSRPTISMVIGEWDEQCLRLHDLTMDPPPLGEEDSSHYLSGREYNNHG